MLTLIYVTRQLTLEEYGIFVTVNSFILFFGIFTFSGLSDSVMRKGAKDFKALASSFEETNGLKLLFGMLAIALCLLSLLFTNYVSSTKQLIAIFSVVLMINTMFSHWVMVFVVLEKFHIRALFGITQQFFYLILTIVAIYYGYKIKLLLSINLLLSMINLIVCLFLTRKYIKFKLNLHKIRFNKNFLVEGWYFFVISLAGLIFAKFDIIMISFLGTPEDVSIYNIPYRISRYGSEIRTAFTAGFFPVLIKQLKETSVSKVAFQKNTFYLFIITILGAYIISVFSSDLIITMFGQKYEYSGKILSVLIFYVAIEFSVYPYILVLLSTHNEKIVARIFIILAISNVCLNYILFKSYGVIGIAYSTLCVMTILAILIYFIGMKQLIKTKIFV